jgi:hypothetical protein
MASFSVKTTQKNPRALDKISKRFRQNNHVLQVGFPKGLASGVVYPSVRDPKNPTQFIKSEAPPRVTDVAFKNEFGSISDNIPPRPFMKKSSKPTERLLKREQKKLAKQLGEKSASPQLLVKFLRLMGPKIEAIFKKTITNLREPGNADLTIAIKGSDNPLIDTGLMRQTLTHLVTRKKKS